MIIPKDNNAAWFNKFADSVNGTRDGLVSGINSILDTVYGQGGLTIEQRVNEINSRIGNPAQILGALLTIRAAINSIDDSPIGEFVAGDGTYFTADQTGKLVIVPPPAPDPVE